MPTNGSVCFATPEESEGVAAFCRRESGITPVRRRTDRLYLGRKCKAGHDCCEYGVAIFHKLGFFFHLFWHSCREIILRIISNQIRGDFPQLNLRAHFVQPRSEGFNFLLLLCDRFFLFAAADFSSCTVRCSLRNSLSNIAFTWS